MDTLIPQVNLRSSPYFCYFHIMKTEKVVTIGAIAKRTGTSVSAIRFYADKGLIPSSRNSGGQRLFSKAVIRRVSFILIAQQLGYSLNDIAKALATLPKQRTPTKADWDCLSRAFRSNIDDQIKQLQRLKETLTGCIGCGCLSLKACQLYNPEDRINKLGSGPRIYFGDTLSNTNATNNYQAYSTKKR